MKLHLNHYQEDLWRYAHIYPANFYNLGWSFLLSGNLRTDLLQKSFTHVVHSVDLLHSVLKGNEQSGLYFETENNGKEIFDMIECSLDECQKDMEQFNNQPFDLSKEWPIRARLYRLPDHSYMFAIIFHHICIDGITVVDFFTMLANVYDLLNKNGEYPQLEIPAWNDALPHEKNKFNKTDFDHWINLLDKNAFETFPLETPTPSSFAFQAEEFELGSDLMERLNEVAKKINPAARKNGATVFLIMMAAWGFVLKRFMGQEQIILETPINQRPKEARNLIGFFANSLLLSVGIKESMRVCDLFTTLIKQWEALRTIRQYTWSEIAYFLNHETKTDLSLRTNIGINFAEWRHAIPFTTIKSQPFRRLDHFSNLDLLLEIEPTQIGFSRIRYHSMFSKAQIQVLVRSLRIALETFSADCDQSLSSISLFPAEEQAQLMNKYEKQLDLLPHIEESIPERFRKIALSQPNHIALIYAGKSVSYADLLVQSERNARRLRGHFAEILGYPLPADEPIGIYTTNKFQAIIWILSILRAGATYVYLDQSFPTDRIAFLANDYGMKCVLCENEQAKRSLPKDLICFTPEELEASTEMDCPAIPASARAYIISTSGTTGQPKGVPIRHEQVLTLVHSGVFVVDASKRVLQFASLCFDASVWEIFFTLLHGSTLIIATEEERHDVERLRKLLTDEHVSVALIPPAVLSRFPHRKIEELESLWVAGESTPEKDIEFWRSQCALYNGYGPTETTVCASAGQLTEQTVPNDIGWPLIGATCYIVDKEGNLTPDFVRGELLVGGPQVTSGYINRPQLNAKKFVPNPFATERDRQLGRNLMLYRTGDLVSRLPSGRMLFHGRIDSQIKLHGFRIELGEIENILNQHPAIVRAVVLIREIRGDKALVAYIQPNATSTLTTQELRTYLSRHVPHYMVPTYWAFVETFQMTVNGKIDTRSLPNPEGKQPEESFVPPITEAEKILARIVAEALGMNQVSVDTNLFDLGLSSIQVMTILAEAANHGLNLSVATFYREKTIRAIVRDHRPSFCFWSEDSECSSDEREILLLVCGDLFYNPEYQYFTKVFSQHYRILVLESFHECFRIKNALDWESLIDFFYTTATKTLNGQSPNVIAGFCLGGELAFSLAQRFYSTNHQPKVLMMGSFSKRNPDDSWSMEYPDTLSTSAETRYEETRQLIRTRHLQPYDGDTWIFLPHRFTFDRIKGLENPDIAAQYRRQYDENATSWSNLQPHIKMNWIDTDHWHLLSPESVEQIYDQFSRLS